MPKIFKKQRSLINISYILLISLIILSSCDIDNIPDEADTVICGGFLKFSEEYPELKKTIDYSKIQVQSFSKDMILKETSTLAASGYYFVPVSEINSSLILKISGPYGMTFEPDKYIFEIKDGKTIKDYCQKDIDFKFIGFEVDGQISTFGVNEGPKGIKLGIFNSAGKKLETTVTSDKGLFKFKPLYPDKSDYIIKPLEKEYMFDEKHKQFSFKININEKNSFKRTLIIKGYELKGRAVTNNDEPMPEVIAAIYSSNKDVIKDYNCQNKISEKNKKYLKDIEKNDDKLKPFCFAETDKNGLFSFKNIPYGQFIVKTFKKNEYTSYTLFPEEQKQFVTHSDCELEKPFKVITFNIYGKVLNGKKKGISNVTIKLDGQVKAVSDKNGVYVLEHVTENNIDLEVQAEHLFFDPMTNLHISPLLPSLPDFIVGDYKLCGKIIIEAKDSFTLSKRTVVLQDKNTSEERKTITDQGGKYCFEVKEGLYKIFPILTDEEKKSELHLQPEYQEIEIVDKPNLEVNFYQSKVKISGKIKCIKDCKNEKNIKIKLVSIKNEQVQETYMDPNTMNYEFTNILSGQYKISIIKNEWCWKEENKKIKVQNKNIEDLNFEQSGYSLFYITHHDINAVCKNVETNNTYEIVLKKDSDRLCLPNEGKHIIYPKSCYLFAQNEYTYDTNNNQEQNIFELNPTELRIKGKIILDNNVIKKLKEKDVKKLNIIINVNSNIENEENNKQQNIKQLDVEIQHNKKETEFVFYTKPNSKIKLIPSFDGKKNSQEIIDTLLFMTTEKIINIESECQENSDNLKFIIKSGILIEGKVSPPIKDIKISAYNKNDNSIITTSLTDEKGKYKIGPLSMEDEYELKAIKEGYKIYPSKENKLFFKCEKLSYLKVKVEDLEGNPLSGVFISLSSSERSFRANNNTNNEGFFTFMDLSSGEYYIQPFLKEYKFEQNQKSILVKEGDHIDIVLKAKRVAFSVFGKVNNLMREKLENLFIQAQNIETKIIQETPIMKNGEYRLKGLVPGEKYSIKVKIPEDSNIERALPINILLDINKNDTFGVDFVVFNKYKEIDIRGYLNYTDDKDTGYCPLTKNSHFYVELYDIDKNDDKIMKTSVVSGACSFIFRKLLPGNYKLKVFEKVTTSEKTNRLIKEEIVNLNENNKDIHNGVKIEEIRISMIQKNKESLRYTIYSPLFLLLLLCAVFKWDSTLKVLNYLFLTPLNMFTSSTNPKREYKNKSKRK